MPLSASGQVEEGAGLRVVRRILSAAEPVCMSSDVTHGEDPLWRDTIQVRLAAPAGRSRHYMLDPPVRTPELIPMYMDLVIEPAMPNPKSQ